MEQGVTTKTSGFIWRVFFSFKNMIALNIIQIIYI
jgi:hypothetical protein